MEKLILKSKEVANAYQPKLVIIKGNLTSQVQLRGENTKEPYYYAFVKLKGQNTDLPVIFKVKKDDNLVEPKLKKGSSAELTGHYSNSEKNVRKSFTCSAYQLLAHE